MTDVILGILWFFVAGNWIGGGLFLYLAFVSMQDAALYSTSFPMYFSTLGIGGFGIALLISGTFFASIAVLISEVRRTRQELLKEGD
jgi:hypothetical protein